jgi:L-ascorbate metabolism protein UlaG (beta-lactamase superfamily)
MKVGNIKIDFLGHAGFLLNDLREGGQKRIVIDPYNVVAGGLVEKADVILLTHSHYDHCSIKDIEKLVKDGTTIVMTADCQSKITKIERSRLNLQVVEVGDKIDLAGGIKVEAVSAYNKDKDFHPKSEGWVGYIVKVGDVIVYHAGDTDFVPEMQKLSGYGKHGNEFVALLPVSGKYVMDAEEAAEAASVLSPDVCVPMHYGAGVAGTIEDAQRFVELCKEKGLKTEILQKI